LEAIKPKVTYAWGRGIQLLIELPTSLTIFSFMCMFCRSLFVLLYFFLLAIVLSVLLRYKDSDYSFDIFKLFLQVTDVERPSCAVTSTAGMCGASSLNIANCSSYTWSSDVEVTFSGTQLNSISSTAGSSVTLTHDNITDLLSGPLIVNVK